MTDSPHLAADAPHALAWIDASSGASGGMLLGALVGAGAPAGVLAEAVDKVAPGEVRLDVEQVRRGGVAATRCRVEVPDATTGRTWREVEHLLGGAGLHEDVRSLAHDVFSRLAEAEGRVHDQPVDDVDFRDLGALDAIVDVVGVCAAVVHLGLERIVVSGELGEPCTPIGTALLTTLADEWGPQPAMSVSRVGVGAGDHDPTDHAGVLRVVVGQVTSTSSTTGDGA